MTQEFKVTPEMTRRYAEELLTMTGDVSYPQIIAIYKDGSVDSGYYAQNAAQGAWHNDDDIIGTIEYREPMGWGGSEEEDAAVTVDDVMTMIGDDIPNTIYAAVENYEG